MDDGSGPSSFDNVRKQTMTREQIAEDETTRWLLRQVGIDPAATESLVSYSVHLDDDGGGVHLLHAVERDGEVAQSGVISFMGGVRGGSCR